MGLPSALGSCLEASISLMPWLKRIISAISFSDVYKHMKSMPPDEIRERLVGQWTSIGERLPKAMIASSVVLTVGGAVRFRRRRCAPCIIGVHSADLAAREPEGLQRRRAGDLHHRLCPGCGTQLLHGGHGDDALHLHPTGWECPPPAYALQSKHNRLGSVCARTKLILETQVPDGEGLVELLDRCGFFLGLPIFNTIWGITWFLLGMCAYLFLLSKVSAPEPGKDPSHFRPRSHDHRLGCC
jgi:hypothetical protein